MKERGVFFAAVFLLVAGCSFLGCGIEKVEKDTGSKLEYEEVKESDIPGELLERIEEEKNDIFRLTWGDGQYLYLARGYGRKKLTGYHVDVLEVQEGKDNIYLKTQLTGPSTEELRKKASCPYLVVRIAYSRKQVLFE